MYVQYIIMYENFLIFIRYYFCYFNEIAKTKTTWKKKSLHSKIEHKIY